MISLDQVFLLEQKVESAVAKIQQLQAENDALRNKCDELTNALSVKSEQLSTFENDQNQIESGIKKALDRLNSIENSVLKAASQMNSNVQAPNYSTKPIQPVQSVQQAPVQQQPIEQQPIFTEEPQQQSEEIQEQVSPSFDTMEPSANFTTEAEIPQNEPAFDNSDQFSFDDTPAEESFEEEIPEDDSTDGLGFDIF